VWRVVERQHLRLVELQHLADQVRRLRIDELQGAKDADVVVDGVRERLGDLLAQQLRKIGAIDLFLGHAAGEGDAAQALHVLHGPVERGGGKVGADEADSE